MLRFAVTGGKGGTGKSMVSVALAYALSKKFKVLLVDLDVDCPDDHLLMNATLKKIKDVTHFVPILDKRKCKKCGVCAKACPENAVVFVEGHYPIFIRDQCIGCKACMYSCPLGAIKEGSEIIGSIQQAKININLNLITGMMKPGYEESSHIVNAVKDYIKDIQKNYDFVVFDTAAGTHCNVISALLDADLALVVTEPTPFGKHDANVMLKLLKKLGIKYYVIVNRHGIGNTNAIVKLAARFKSKILSYIPYSRDIARLYSLGRPVEHESINKIVNKLVKEKIKENENKK